MEKTQNNGLEYLPYKFTAKELDEETGLYYYGARYLDPKYSMWISTDPALGDYIPKAPINEEAKKHNQNLPGMGGVFNHINGDLYAYAGNNPVRYIDPDGREAGDLFDSPDEAAKDFAKNYNDDSIKHNRELGSSIYKTKDDKFYYTIPYKGAKTSVKPTEIRGEKRVGVIHTHTNGFQMDRYSDTDIILANNEGCLSYLVISDGVLLKYDPSKPYDIEKNPIEIYQYESFPNLKNFNDYPNSDLIKNPLSRILYYFNGGK